MVEVKIVFIYVKFQYGAYEKNKLIISKTDDTADENLEYFIM